MAGYESPSSPPGQRDAERGLVPSCPSSPATTRASPLSDRYKQKHPMLSGPNHIEGMKEFMHKHLREILKPFADEIVEVHATINGLSSKVSQVASKLDNSLQADTERQGVLNRLQADMESTQSKVEFNTAKLDGEIQNVRQERAAITKEVEKATHDVKELRNSHDKVQAHNDTEQKNHSTAIDKLQTDLEEFKESNLKVVRALQNQAASLEKAQQWASETCDQSEKLRQKDHEDLRSLTDNCRLRWQQDKETDELVSRTMNRLEAGVSKIEERLKDLHSEAVKHAISCVDTLMRQMSATSRAQTVLESQQKMTEREIQGVKDSILKHNKILGCTADSHKNELKLIETVKLMREQVLAHDSKVQDLSQNRTRVNNDLQDRTARISILEELEPKLQATMASLQQQMDSRLQAMANSIDQNDHSKRITKVEKAREDDKADFLQLIQRQEEETHKVHLLQEGLSSSAKATDEKLRRLQGSVSEAVNELAVLRGGLETTTDYWNGLTQGMEKVHQNVSIDGGLLSPAKYPRKLPALNLD